MTTENAALIEQRSRLGLAAYSFLLDHPHSSPIYLDIKNRNRLAFSSGKNQLDRFSDLRALPLGDMLSKQLLRCALQTWQ